MRCSQLATLHISDESNHFLNLKAAKDNPALAIDCTNCYLNGLGGGTKKVLKWREGHRQQELRNVVAADYDHRVSRIDNGD